jgi:murein DD-endopeptidase MepM/ murein hydrolase activator NlpD
MVVHVDDYVKRGQVIATVDHKKASPIHFEIRDFGKPLNPKQYLLK